ncbi:DUF2188 domain-containing protein [Marinifilum sp. D737]|uniref:DUF2188 domain-containing protein n=1 Tax=Marinifilum sp. D737 TaxID=2969628 RepID=UPI0022765DEC|nr:DUF2188 domain-containing protein [Marinifilum sp. D737]MCY1633919.1 DUF2188 domain-containing protein [Marinifilum sp. D737]
MDIDFKEIHKPCSGLMYPHISFAKIEYLFKNKETMGKNQHVVPHNNKWAVKGAGNVKCTRITETQSEAIKIAREISSNQKSELIIHRRNGKIREKDSHGKDPFPPRG